MQHKNISLKNEMNLTTVVAVPKTAKFPPSVITVSYF